MIAVYVYVYKILAISLNKILRLCRLLVDYFMEYFYLLLFIYYIMISLIAFGIILKRECNTTTIDFVWCFFSSFCCWCSLLLFTSYEYCVCVMSGHRSSASDQKNVHGDTYIPVRSLRKSCCYLLNLLMMTTYDMDLFFFCSFLLFFLHIHHFLCYRFICQRRDRERETITFIIIHILFIILIILINNMIRYSLLLSLLFTQAM